MNAVHHKAGLLLTDFLALVSGATAVASRVDELEQWLRILATVVAIIAGSISIYRRLKDKSRR